MAAELSGSCFPCSADAGTLENLGNSCDSCKGSGRGVVVLGVFDVEAIVNVLVVALLVIVTVIVVVLMVVDFVLVEIVIVLTPSTTTAGTST